MVKKSRISTYLLIHQSGRQIRKKFSSHELKSSDKWRLRNYDKHPVDPGWEIGLYCLCHRHFRDAHSRNLISDSTTYVLDGVNVGGKHFVRSMFKIDGRKPCGKYKGQDLLFNEYYFAPKQETQIVCVQDIRGLKSFKGAQVKKLSEKLSYDVVNRIKKDYEYLRKSQKPSTIDLHDWKFMCEKASEHRKLSSNLCHSCE